MNRTTEEVEMRKLVAAVALVSALMMPVMVRGQDAKPIQLALLTPLQIVPQDDAVRGVRLSLLYGRNSYVTGFDLGLVSHTTGDFTGVQLGLVNIIKEGGVLPVMPLVNWSFEEGSD